MAYYFGIDTQACCQLEVVFNAGWLFCFSLLRLPVPLICVGEPQLLHLDTSEIHRANIAVNEREGSLDRIIRLACLGHPLISGSSKVVRQMWPSAASAG